MGSWYSVENVESEEVLIVEGPSETGMIFAKISVLVVGGTVGLAVGAATGLLLAPLVAVETVIITSAAVSVPIATLGGMSTSIKGKEKRVVVIPPGDTWKSDRFSLSLVRTVKLMKVESTTGDVFVAKKDCWSGPTNNSTRKYTTDDFKNRWVQLS